ncbi:MAG: class II fructose-bisphosphate aldolase [Patescibacteria group bacterium]
MKTIQTWFARAQAEGFAIGAFNVANLETFKAVIQAAVNQKSPALLESSDGETAYVGADNLVDLVANARAETGLPIFLNLDHSREIAKVQIALNAGYDLVHFDGSKESPAKNIDTLRRVVRMAHSRHILVEGELDYIIEGSEVRSITAEEGRAASQLSDPETARAFVEETDIDTFAVSIGNVHGLYTTPKKLDLTLLEKIRGSVDCFLSLHGGSGISDDQIRHAIAVGRIVKINISSELRQALRQGLEHSLQSQPNEVAMYKITPAAIENVQKIVESKMKLFGSSHKV